GTPEPSELMHGRTIQMTRQIRAVMSLAYMCTRLDQQEMTQQKKPRKVGRPKLPKGEAKGRIVPVRFTPDETRVIEAAARASKQTVSEWIRSMLNAAIQ